MSDRANLVKIIEAVRARPIALGLPINFVFCSVIGLIVGYFNQRYGQSLAVSYCIGFSIMFCQIIGHSTFQVRFNRKVISTIALIIGFVVGELVAGVLVFDEVFFLLASVPYMLVLGFVIGAITLSALFFLDSFALTTIELSQAEAKMARQEHAVALAELKALQAQVEPHFLFNTLANIHSLIDADPSHAALLLEKLSDFLRSTLDYSRRESTTLDEEIEFSKAYLDVQVARLQERLDYELNIDSQLGSIEVPPLILQPLIENAVIHGIEPKPQGGTIAIQAIADEKNVHIAVNDNGVGIDNNTESTPGTGLSNLRDRLATFYEDTASLKVTSRPSGGASAEISISFKHPT